MKKKILISAYTCVSESGVEHAGGEAELGYNIVMQMSRFYDVYVLTHYYNQKAIEEKLMAKDRENIKFYYVRLPGILSFLEKFHKGGIQVYAYLWQIKAYFLARKLHKKINFDLFHHVTYANDWMASFAGALLPIPYIRGPGGGAHRVPKAFLKNFSFYERLADIIRNFGQWIFRHDPFFVLGQSRAKALLVCNKEAFNALPKKWQKKGLFFPVNGIKKEEFFAQPNAGENVFRIFSAGKLLKIKGFDLTLKVFAIFCKKATDAKLVIAGDGPEMDNLKNLSKNLGIEKKVIFKGWLKRESILQEMADCDIFLFASLRDGGGNVVVEAMAQGKPVVCFDIAGPGFHVDETCGIKIKPENPEQALKDMAQALEKLYIDKSLRDALGRGARAKVEREYDWNKLGEKLQKIYEGVFKK